DRCLDHREAQDVVGGFAHHRRAGTDTRHECRERSAELAPRIGLLRDLERLARLEGRRTVAAPARRTTGGGEAPGTVPRGLGAWGAPGAGVTQARTVAHLERCHGRG